MRTLKNILLSAIILIVVVAALAVYLVRGGFHREITPYPIPPAALTNWNDVLASTLQPADRVLAGTPVDWRRGDTKVFCRWDFSLCQVCLHACSLSRHCCPQLPRRLPRLQFYVRDG